MPGVGRNAPCPCGSGKKYKQCHGPIDAESAAQQRRLKRAPDTLLPKMMEALDGFGAELPAAINAFWNGAYTVHDIKELDDHQDRGSERFLTWFAFDARDDEGQTPVQRLIAKPDGLELSDAEAQVLAGWADVRLQPYTVVEVRKGFGLTVRPLFGEQTLDVEDHAAAKHIEPGEVLITHLIPAGDSYFVAGAAAHLTADTIDKLHEFTALYLADLQRTQPDATHADLIQTRSQVFNHFVMALPREEQEASRLDELVAMTRATLSVTASQLGLKREQPTSVMPVLYDPPTDDAEDTELAAASTTYKGQDD
jgi:hypothetical protein